MTELNEITRKEPEIERVERFQSLQAGQYWRALLDVVEEGIDKGTVLLIQSIRWVDDAPHTIILRPHPSKIGTDTYLQIPQGDGTTRKAWFRFNEHRFLLKDFLAQFEFEPDHQIVRSEELRQIQGRINALQGELIEAQSNPALLAGIVEAGLRGQEQQKATADTDEKDDIGRGAALPVVAGRDLISLATGTVVDVLGTGITVEGIASLKEAANREHQVATIKAEWIQGKTSEIAETIQAMTPFYSEQAAAALAQTEDVRSHVAKLMRGIESLDLYVGKDVEVETICTGDTAPKDVPLTFVQKKLLMDEELAVWADIDEWFDFSKEDKFFDAIRKHDSLINQIFPTERCVLVMAVTRRDIDYGDAFTNAARNTENKKVFLLVRDGMNVHRVFSPVESHLGAARLFPSKNDQDGVFRGMDGSRIKFEDIAYTDRLAAHEKFALHYKRFLLLVCGLDHRLKLFGDFYEGPQSFHFVSMDFQERHCRFLHDDDGSGLLPSGENRMPLKEWGSEKNSYLRSGSRVLCNWGDVMNPSTAPGACKEERGGSGFDRRYTPKNSMGVAIAYREGESICVDVEVSGYSYSSHGQRTFTSKVNLSKFKNGQWEYTDQPFLCLDAVRPEELHRYIHNRDERRNHLAYIRFFKHALKHIQAELVAESDTRQRLSNALAEGNIASGDEADGIIHQAVIAWRAANRGKPLPHFDGNSAPAAWKSLLDQMYMLAGEGKRRTLEIEAFVRGLGYDPLRLVLSGGAKLVVYAAPTSDECDDRIEPHAWVHRITIERGKTKCIEKSRRWIVLPKSAASETTLHQWEASDQWSGRDSAFLSFERKQEILGEATDFAAGLRPFIGTMDATTNFLQVDDLAYIREDMMSKSKYVLNPSMAVPFGVVYYPRSNELRYLCVGSSKPHALLYRLAPDDAAREQVQSSFIKPYARKDKAREDFARAHESKSIWSLMEITISTSQSRCGVYCDGEHEIEGKARFDPSLAPWFENWMAEVNKYGRVWLADGAVDDSGHLVFDDMLDIKPPVGLDPVQVVEITVLPHDGAMPLTFTRWFDICRGKEAPRVSGNGWWPGANGNTKWLVEGCAPEGSFGWKAQTHHLASLGEAREFIESQVTAVSGVEGRVIPANDLMGAPRPPEGVERWYVVGAEARAVDAGDQ